MTAWSGARLALGLKADRGVTDSYRKAGESGVTSRQVPTFAGTTLPI
ncbi:MAG: hypothetical protein ABJF07_26325 [Nisaea sp.]